MNRPFNLPVRAPGIRGAYHLGLALSTAAGPAANALHASFRWASSSVVCVITRLALRLSQPTPSSAGLPTFALVMGRSFTAAHTGGTAVTVTGNSLKKRTADPTTALGSGDARFVSGGVLAGGTVTLDADPCMVVAGSSTGSFEAADGPSRDLREDPIVLAQNEGFVLRNLVSQTGGITLLSLNMEWVEMNLGTLEG